MARESGLPSSLGNVPNIGGHRSGQAGFDYGAVCYFRADLQQHRRKLDAQFAQAASANLDVYPYDSDLRHDSGFVLESVFSKNERDAWPLCSSDYRKLHNNLSS